MADVPANLRRFLHSLWRGPVSGPSVWSASGSVSVVQIEKACAGKRTAFFPFSPSAVGWIFIRMMSAEK